MQSIGKLLAQYKRNHNIIQEDDMQYERYLYYLLHNINQIKLITIVIYKITTNLYSNG